MGAGAGEEGGRAEKGQARLDPRALPLSAPVDVESEGAGVLTERGECRTGHDDDLVHLRIADWRRELVDGRRRKGETRARRLAAVSPRSFAAFLTAL